MRTCAKNRELIKNIAVYHCRIVARTGGIELARHRRGEMLAKRVSSYVSATGSQRGARRGKYPLRSGSLEKQRARLLPALHHVGTHFELVQTRAE
jgi:hypothetical protein